MTAEQLLRNMIAWYVKATRPKRTPEFEMFAAQPIIAAIKDFYEYETWAQAEAWFVETVGELRLVAIDA